VSVVVIEKQKDSAGGAGAPASSELSTDRSTVEPSGARRSTTMSVPLPLRSGSPSALMKSVEVAGANTE
jgi:hypothetical protein